MNRSSAPVLPSVATFYGDDFGPFPSDDPPPCAMCRPGPGKYDMDDPEPAGEWIVLRPDDPLLRAAVESRVFLGPSRAYVPVCHGCLDSGDFRGSSRLDLDDPSVRGLWAVKSVLEM